MTFSPAEGAVTVMGVSGVVALSFTPADINTAIVGVTALITAIGILIVNIINARTASKKYARQEAKIDETLSKTSVIEGHVNSAAAVAAATIVSQEKQIADLKAALLVQAARTDPPAAVIVDGTTNAERKDAP